MVANGPSRSAKELGIWRDSSGQLFRVIISRFVATEATTKRGGAGREIGGWHYELFLADLPADAWPAHDTVRLYYDHCGQENRFGMLNRRYNLGRIFSFHKQGQVLATLVALVVWNIEVLLGAEALGDWDENHPDLEPEPRNDIMAPPPASDMDLLDVADLDANPDSDEPRCDAEMHTNENIDGVKANQSPLEPSEPSDDTTIEQAFSRKMQDWLAKHPGWTNHGPTLVCPAGTPMASSLFDSTNTSIAVRFRSSASACRGCSLRGGCTSSVNTPNFRKEIQMSVHATRVTDEELAALAFSKRSAPLIPPSTTFSPNGDETSQPAFSSIHPGPYACQMSRLRGGELLRLFDESSYRSRYAIDVQVPINPHLPLPAAIAPTPALRQQRRKTLAERIAWNELPTGSTVRLITVRSKQRLADPCDVGAPEAA